MDREHPCAYCRRHHADARWQPFCSERCKLLDLSRWIDGTYRIPDEAAPAAEPGDSDTDPPEE
ncbi:MAG: DNA gyrase inhibitor YacG [Planctomycetes bacterium]|nr:DNA gyrase inhibitor YacG [Planctomycetota bacterium]